MSIKDLFSKIKGSSTKGGYEGSSEDPSEEPRKVVNGYLQTSNTKVIRPVYSNTKEGRAARKS